MSNKLEVAISYGEIYELHTLALKLTEGKTMTDLVMLLGTAYHYALEVATCDLKQESRQNAQNAMHESSECIAREMREKVLETMPHHPGERPVA